MSSAVNLQNSNLFNLHGRIALVSGGGTGIGLMITRGLATNGAKVYIGGRRKEVLETVAAELSVPGKGTVIPYVRLEIRSLEFCTDKLSSKQVCPSMSQIVIALSRRRISLKKMTVNYTSW